MRIENMKHSIQRSILAWSVIDTLVKIDHFPKTLAGQTRPLLFSN
jgi:hypothetical protein